jgi:hypothetical protein
MQIGNTTWTYLGYHLAPHGRDGDDYLFDATYQTDLGHLGMRYRLRLIDGEWKVVDMDRIDRSASP